MAGEKKYRVIMKRDAQGNLLPNSAHDTIFLGEYTGTNLIYAGFARPGTSSSDTGWKIMKLTYDGSDNLLTTTYPENALGAASSDNEFIWDSRAGYTYA